MDEHDVDAGVGQNRVWKHDRASGPRSTTWTNAAGVAMILFALSCAAVVVFIVFMGPHFRPPWWPVVAQASIWALEGSVLFLLLCIGGYQIQYRREAALGYTFSRLNYGNAAQLDPKSWRVIREPGEPLLSLQEQRARTVAVRAHE